MTMEYPAIVHREGDTFWIEIPGFPEASTRGAVNEDDPNALAQELLEVSVLCRIQGGIPPSSSEEFWADRNRMLNSGDAEEIWVEMNTVVKEFFLGRDRQHAMIA